MHDCVVKLLRSNDEESFECLCKLLVTIGKDLDHEKAKVNIIRMPIDVTNTATAFSFSGCDQENLLSLTSLMYYHRKLPGTVKNSTGKQEQQQQQTHIHLFCLSLILFFVKKKWHTYLCEV